MKLKQSKVKYDPIQHTYNLNGVFLSGITGILSKYLFPDKYDSIPKHILQAAAERGSKVHADCEFYDRTGFSAETNEVENYIRLKNEHNLVTVANEYIVSDEQYIASPIDLVLEDTDKSVNIADIKTTSKLDKEYLSWQLSVYAYLFEQQNKKIKVNKLFGIWLRNEIAEVVPVNRKPDEEVKNLLDKAIHDIIHDVQVVDPIKSETQYPAEIVNAELSIIEIETQLSELSSKRDELKSGILSLMQQHNIDKYESERLRLTRKSATVSNRFDSTSFKKDHPNMYNSYLKQSEVAASLTIKVL